MSIPCATDAPTLRNEMMDLAVASGLVQNCTSAEILPCVLEGHLQLPFAQPCVEHLQLWEELKAVSGIVFCLMDTCRS